jgi:16S rRNA (cytosine967-C5)-methyltransferase
MSESPRVKTQYPRGPAIRVLTQVLSDHKTLDEALNGVSAELGLSTPARAWLQEVCSGTLRWKGRLDSAIDSVALKKKPTGWLRKALLIAAYQLIVQDRAQPGAVVSETVSEIKSREGEAPAKFANACLRKLAEHARSFRELEIEPKATDAEVARWASLPEWIWLRLTRDHGFKWAQAYAEASLGRPTLWGRFKDGMPISSEALAGPIPGSFSLRAGVVTEMPGFQEGRFFIQDISSQLLIHEMSELVRKELGSGTERSKLTVLDLCAAPGGKSAGLAWNGFEVTATDRPLDGGGAGASSRFALLNQTLARVAPTAKVMSREEVGGLSPQDWVWVDAPCSGSGILRRHPDVRWLRQEKELLILARVQKELLEEAWEKVAPGGFLTYSVCSVLGEEGPGRLQEFCEKVGAVVSQKWLLSPQQEPYGDGFWAGIVRKMHRA